MAIKDDLDKILGDTPIMDASVAVSPETFTLTQNIAELINQHIGSNTDIEASISFLETLNDAFRKKSPSNSVEVSVKLDKCIEILRSILLFKNVTQSTGMLAEDEVRKEPVNGIRQPDHGKITALVA